MPLLRRLELLFLAGLLGLAACASAGERGLVGPRRDAWRCLASHSWLDRVEDGVEVWIDPDGGIRSVEPAARSPPAIEGELRRDGLPSPTCAAHLRAYVRALRQGRVPAGDNGAGLLL